jgi:hypothetical protein
MLTQPLRHLPFALPVLLRRLRFRISTMLLQRARRSRRPGPQRGGLVHRILVGCTQPGRARRRGRNRLGFEPRATLPPRRGHFPCAQPISERSLDRALHQRRSNNRPPHRISLQPRPTQRLHRQPITSGPHLHRPMHPILQPHTNLLHTNTMPSSIQAVKQASSQTSTRKRKNRQRICTPTRPAGGGASRRWAGVSAPVRLAGGPRCARAPAGVVVAWRLVSSAC